VRGPKGKASLAHAVQPPAAWLGAVLLCAATFAAYYPSLDGKFILDDILLVSENPLLHASDGLYRIWFTTEPIDYWPVFNSSFWLEWRLWEADPTGYHVANVALHAANALLIWIVLSRLAIPGGFVAALLFALHPVNVESVAWISQRKGLLAMFFSLLSVLGYLRSERRSGQGRAVSRDAWYWISLALFLLAMLSKGSVAVLPVMLLGVIWWQRPLVRRDFVRTAPFFLVAITMIAVTMWFQARGVADDAAAPSLIERLLGAGAVVWFYACKAIAPFRLAFIYPQWEIDPTNPAWWLPGALALGVTAWLWHHRDRQRPLLFAWLFFCVALAPVMGLTRATFMEFSLVADHYQYTALIAVVALAGSGWSQWRRRAPRSADAVAAAVVCLFGVLTWRQSALYADSITLYRASLELSPTAWMAHNNLAAELFDAGDAAGALQHAQAAVDLKPDYAEAHNNLGNALSRAGRIPDAIEHYRRTLDLRPNHIRAHNNLGSTLAYTGRIEEAIAHFERALQIKPDYAEARENLETARAIQRGQESGVGR